VERFLSRLAISIATALAALIVLLGAFVFLCMAAYTALLTAFTPPIAALLTAAGAIVLALLILLIGRATARGAAQRRRFSDAGIDGLREPDRSAAEAAGALGAQFAAMARANKGKTLLVSLAAGFALGFSPRLRKMLLDLLSRG
jgi:hypothetical protein